MSNIDVNKLEDPAQVIVYNLAKMGYLTSGGDIQRALSDPTYAKYMIRQQSEIDVNADGIIDDIDRNAPVQDKIEAAKENTTVVPILTPEEIETVFEEKE